MFILAFVSCLAYVILLCMNVEAQNSFNVMNYGAAGNGITDDSLAFKKAWNAACLSPGTTTMIIPKGKTFLLQPMTFAGPCKSSKIIVMILGTILPPTNPKEWKAEVDISRWLTFIDISWLIVDGNGVIDGRGQGWWDIACRYHPRKGCLNTMPTVVRFENCSNMRMSHVQIINSPQTHILVFGCQNADLGFLNLNSPETSPNTDGIHISASSGIKIHDSHISSGDDCISIGDAIAHLTILDIYCGPGHGISIGSLGGGGSEAHVENIIVQRANFTGTTNGARIKTWQVGRGYVRDIHFSDLTFNAVENPIIIDQHYGDLTPPAGKTGVRISDVSYSRAHGTSKTPTAINLNCSSNVPCTNITLDTISLASIDKGQQLSSSCNYVHGVTKGIVDPKSCLVG